MKATYYIQDNQNQSGAVLVTVVCFAALAAVLAAKLMTDSTQQIMLAKRQTQAEQAFYLAEAGAEQAASYLVTGNFENSMASISGTMASGSFTTYIFGLSANTDPTPAEITDGEARINPNNSTNQFFLLGPNGVAITRNDLLAVTQGGNTNPLPYVYYSGPANVLQFRPQTPGGTLTVDGSTMNLAVNQTYRLASPSLNIEVVLKGPGLGQWHIQNINGSDITMDATPGPTFGLQQFNIISQGYAGGGRRKVIMSGVRQQTWARFALWYNHSGGAIWVCGTETFDGPVHANTQIYLQDMPVFNAPVSSAANQWGPGSTLTGVTFNQGFQLGVDAQDMVTVNFNILRDSANMVLTGPTEITLMETNMVVSNADEGWINQTIPIPSDGVIYVASDADPGRVTIGGNLDERITIVAEQDIRITNHITYATHPTNSSDNALGLIANRNIVVRTNAPNNLNIFAHMIACNTATNYSAGFYVQNYNDTGVGGRGELMVYGGIVQRNRGAVGLVGATAGFAKNYIYDQRFFNNPPPQYPTLDDQFMWTGWKETPF